jgi:hypothetical protein
VTEKEVRQLVAMLIGAFPHTKANEFTVKAYERMLVDLDVKLAAATVEHLMATRTFMPTIAEVRSTCAEMQHGPVAAGGEAWGQVLHAIGRYGYYRVPGQDFTFADPVVARCVEAMGWRNLCSSENQVADRARFTELYDKLAKQERVDVVAGALPAVRAARELRERTGDAKPIAALLSPSTDELQ